MLSLNFVIKLSIAHQVSLDLPQAQLLISPVPHMCILN